MSFVKTAVALLVLGTVAGAAFVVPPLLYARQTLSESAPEAASIGVSVRDAAGPGAQAAGVLVVRVQSNGPAEQSGIEAGDVITTFDGRQVQQAREFRQMVRETAPGTTVAATIVRNGRVMEVRITPAGECDLTSIVARL